MKVEFEESDVVKFKVGDIILAKHVSCISGSHYLVGGAPDKFGVVLINLKDPENVYKLDSLSHIGNVFNYNHGWRIEKFTGKVTLLAE